MDPFIAQHLQGVSRTYAILVPMLPPPLDEVVGLAYLVMRIVDTVEDETRISTEQRLELLDHLDRALDGDRTAAEALVTPIGDLEAERDLMSESPAVFERVQALDPVHRDATRVCARTMMNGVRTLVGRSDERGQPYPAVRDIAELREYCYYVAGTVGEMLCAMMAHHLDKPEITKMRQLAVELGTGLQLVNILKDACKDSTQGRRYLPVVTESASHASIYHEALTEGRRSLRLGVDYVLNLPSDAPKLRTFCGLPIAWGAMTLARAEDDETAAKIGREAIQASIVMFGQIAQDDETLREWLTKLIDTPSEPATTGR